MWGICWGLQPFIPRAYARGIRTRGSEIMSEIVRVRYTHDAMIDVIIATPMISQNELAAMFGYTPAWISTIMCSDAFQEKLLLRRNEMVNPGIASNVNERFRGLAQRSLEVLNAKLSQPVNMVSDELALKAAGLAAKAMNIGGFGVMAPPVAAPEAGRLDRLAERLKSFLPNKNLTGEIVDAVPLANGAAGDGAQERPGLTIDGEAFVPEVPTSTPYDGINP